MSPLFFCGEVYEDFGGCGDGVGDGGGVGVPRLGGSVEMEQSALGKPAEVVINGKVDAVTVYRGRGAW